MGSEQKAEAVKKVESKKFDGYFTLLENVEKELEQTGLYKDFFKGKVVLCNCNDFPNSAFFRFFIERFEKWGIRRLICTHYEQGAEQVPYFDWSGEYLSYGTPKYHIGIMNGDGNCLTGEALTLLDECDIVVTNPSASLFDNLLAEIENRGKQFILMLPAISLGNKNIFDKIYTGEYVCGCNTASYSEVYVNEATGVKLRTVNDKQLASTPLVWLTNLTINKNINLTNMQSTYKGNEQDYPKIDNYNAIDCSRQTKIPKDYKDIIAVPISYLQNINTKQFEILGITSGKDEYSELAWPSKRYTNLKYYQNGVFKMNRSFVGAVLPTTDEQGGYLVADDIDYKLKPLFTRLLIKRKAIELSYIIPKVINDDTFWYSNEPKIEYTNETVCIMLEEIEQEVLQSESYILHFQNKVILCNIADSNGVYYEFLKIYAKKLGYKYAIVTFGSEQNEFFMMRLNAEDKLEYYYNGDMVVKYDEFIQESDMYFGNAKTKQMIEWCANDYKFISNIGFGILGNDSLIENIKNGVLKAGYRFCASTKLANGVATTQLCWVTNIDINKNIEEMVLTSLYRGNEQNYPKYIGEDIIEVSKYTNIPKDYNGLMGIAVSTFIGKYSPEQFEIIGVKKVSLLVDGKEKSLKRLIIRRKG